MKKDRQQKTTKRVKPTRQTVIPESYNPAHIEPKWQKYWAKNKTFKSVERTNRAKSYILDMFPYPSGEGLHVGHPKGYIATDVVSRFQRMNGKAVLHPMGFDAFGLPAENYALKTKTNPADGVKKNVLHFKKQLEILGFDYDWSREINTTDPKYYRWTQWIFLQMFKKGLAYESNEPINWCPSCKTGLANEDIEDGRCERCGTVVEKKPMRQWVLKITDYADRLLNDLDAKNKYEIPVIVDKVNPHQKGKPTITRHVAHAIVFDPKTDKYLIIRNKKHGWDTVVIGGIENNEDIIETAGREVREETGYTDLKFMRVLGEQTEAHYFAKHKGENRIAIARAVYFELVSDKKIAIADGEDPDNEILWIDKNDFVPGKMINSELPIWLERLNDPQKGWSKPLLDWPESIKEAQRNWIGRSEGAMIKFKIFGSEGVGSQKYIEVFTTRPDTLFGVTYIVLAPEHRLVSDLLSNTSNRTEVEEYISKTKIATDIERTDAKKEKTGVQLKGVEAVNPANGEKVPVWIADYVLPDYGTGAVMAVPAHDERDWQFAKKFGLPIRYVIMPEKGNNIQNSEEYTGDGILIDSGKFSGQNSISAKKEITSSVGGQWVTKYKLRDWVFSRQRYWGEPIPLIHCENCALLDPSKKGIVPVPEKDLPVILPRVKSYEPTGTGESPLAAIAKWVNVKCPNCKGKAKRETNTMPQWAGSSWYYLRYMDPKNSKSMVDHKKEKYWSPVDLYVGGAEHATRHLIYARFWHKFLLDIGIVSTIEPFMKLRSVGLIMGEDGQKMSKRFGNVVDPDDIVKVYGADTLRLYEMFMGPFDQQISWSTGSIVGARRFLERVWKLAHKCKSSDKTDIPTGFDDLKLEKMIHKTIKKVTEDIGSLSFNTAVSSLMILSNEFEKVSSFTKDQYEKLLLLLSPFVPHLAEELWMKIGNKKSISLSKWPEYDPHLVTDDEVTIVVQVNGKVRGSFKAPSDMSEQDLEKRAINVEEAKKWFENMTIKKIIVVKGRLVNIVI